VVYAEGYAASFIPAPDPQLSVIALVVLIVALDWPFRGEISVTPDPFVMTQQSWSQVSFDKK
jgi:hypothetical protein